MRSEYAQQRAGIARDLGQPVLTPTNLNQMPGSSAMTRDLNAKLKVTLTDEIGVCAAEGWHCAGSRTACPDADQPQPDAWLIGDDPRFERQAEGDADR